MKPKSVSLRVDGFCSVVDVVLRRGRGRQQPMLSAVKVTNAQKADHGSDEFRRATKATSRRRENR